MYSHVSSDHVSNPIGNTVEGICDIVKLTITIRSEDVKITEKDIDVKHVGNYAVSLWVTVTSNTKQISYWIIIRQYVKLGI